MSESSHSEPGLIRTVKCKGTNEKTKQPCLTEFSIDNSFCFKCGTKVPKLRLCNGTKKDGSKCSAEIAEDGCYCGICGRKVSDGEEEVPSSTQNICHGKLSDGTPCTTQVTDDSGLCASRGPSETLDNAKEEPEDSQQTAKDDMSSSESPEEKLPAETTSDAFVKVLDTEDGEPEESTGDTLDLETSETHPPRESSPMKNESFRNEQQTVPASSLGSVSGMVKVLFKGIISDEWKFNPKVDKAFIRLVPLSKDHSVLLEVGKKTDAGYLVTGEFPLTKEERNKGQEYKYVIDKFNEKQKRFEETYEHLQMKSSYIFYGTDVNRNWSVPEKEKQNTDDLLRIDGIIYPPLTTTGKVTTYWTQKYVKDLEIMFKDFLPQAKEMCTNLTQPKPQQTAESYLKEIGKTVTSATYPRMIGTVFEQDRPFITKMLHSRLIQPLLEAIAERLSSASGKHTATLALFIVRLCDQHKLQLTPGIPNSLCRALLVNPDLDKRTVPDLEYLTTHFPVMMQDRRQRSECVKTLIKSTGDKPKSCDWLFTIPLLHFLEELVTPFEVLTPSPQYKAPNGEWWGIGSFEDRKSAFKKSYQQLAGEVEEIQQTVAKLEPIFPADAYLCRSVVASLEYTTLLPVLLKFNIPIEVVAATLAHHVHHAGTSEKRKKVEGVLLLVIKKLCEILEQEQHKRGSATSELRLTRCQVHIVQDFFCEILGKDLFKDKRSNETIPMCTVQLMFLMLDRLALDLDIQNTHENLEEWQPRAREIVEKIDVFMAQRFSFGDRHMDDKKLFPKVQAWGQLMQYDDGLKHNGLKGYLKKSLGEKFEAAFSEISANHKLSVFLNLSESLAMFADTFTRLVFSSLEQVFRDQATRLKDEAHSSKLSALLSTLLERKWKERETDHVDAFTFTVTWQPMVHYLTIAKNTNSYNKLSQLARQFIGEAMQSVTSKMESLASGDVTISSLKFMDNNQDRLVDVFKCADLQKNSLANLLKIRKHELKAFDQNSIQVAKLFENCQEYLKTDDVQTVKQHIDKIRQDADESCLSAVVKVTPAEELNVDRFLETYKPRSNPWKLLDGVFETLPDFDSKMDSKVFCKMLSSVATSKRTELSSTTFWRAFLVLWEDVTKEWRALCQSMTDGSISLADAERVFLIFIKSDGSYKFEDIRTELGKIAGNSKASWIDERMSQFTAFIEIKQHVEAATVILQLKDIYQMTEGFQDIDRIFKLGHNEDLSIQEMDESVRDVCTQLEGLEPRDISSLKCFLENRCQQLVMWIRNTMKGGLKELKVFVDLASISAGEEPYFIDNVGCFYNAATGFAPLMFMEPAEKDFNHLMTQVWHVLKNIKDEPKLPQKLRDVSAKLEWFQDVQRSHGSVEKTAMTQVCNISSRGVFKIGTVKAKGMDEHNVITLDVSEDSSGDKPPRRYTYTELMDLQSRLMLVAGQAGKGKEEVDQFIAIMDSMVRLGKKYVQLCKDGCILFLDWSVNFLCDTSSPVCCTAEFAGQEMLKGHRLQQDLQDFIAGVAGFLEQCHDEWMAYVDRKRKEYPEFNLYLIKQLVFLQQELVQIDQGKPYSVDLLPMLSLLKPDCSQEDVTATLEDAKDAVDKLKNQRRDQEEELTKRHEEKKGMKEKIAKFMKDLKEVGITREMASKALEVFGPDESMAGILWCMDPINKKPAEEMESQSLDEEGRVQGQRLRQLVTSHQSIVDSTLEWLHEIDTGEDTLKEMLGNFGLVWKKFLESVSAGFQDFLSLEHLGIFLRCLADRDQKRLFRTLPPEFNKGAPNLLLCRKMDMLNAITYLYNFPAEFTSNAKEAREMCSIPPLPQHDEVLLCTEKTSSEEVDIFLRRAFLDKQNGKVYCLAFADNLAYDVGEFTEKRIKELGNQSEIDYHLVVICTSESQYKSHVVAALERYIRPTSETMTSEQVCDYLSKRFSGVTKINNTVSASSLDPERLSVRVIRSNRSGIGKTLYMQRSAEKLKAQMGGEGEGPVSISIPLHCKVADTPTVASLLLKHAVGPDVARPKIVHLDVSYQVLEGVDHLLYHLLVLGCVKTADGRVWLRSPMDLYIVEAMPLYDQQDNATLVHQIFSILPSLQCWSPSHCLDILRDSSRVPGFKEHDPLCDDREFSSERYQRVLHYLQALKKDQPPTRFDPNAPLQDDKAGCLEMLMEFCGVDNPSWSELTHFVSFLNKQLMDFESSDFCGLAAADMLPGFTTFALRFLVLMSRDFATRSLDVSEQSLEALKTTCNEADADIRQYQLRRTWETSPHPYIFFNPDGSSMTFLGFAFEVRGKKGDLIDQQTKDPLPDGKGIISLDLLIALNHNGVPFNEHFDSIPRSERLRRLYRVFGVEDKNMVNENGEVIDPDETYELTTDNVKKILAIYMRFRCNIPVIVMGETGCGKTRLVKFLCALQTAKQKMTTMVLVKVHGGTTVDDILRKVHQAEELAKTNAAKMTKSGTEVTGADSSEGTLSRPIYTVLFFDEANTTEAIGAIKEVMCDGTLNGKPITLDKNLRMVACCNPYRKHTDDLIKRLENAGLGYHVDADKTTDKLGRVPMRHLVYRVQPLPQSMLPLVWDFGQLSPDTEQLYIKQMVRRYVERKELAKMDQNDLDALCIILIKAQEFMREQKDECSFVSLRDVERTLLVMTWFHSLAAQNKQLFMRLQHRLVSDARGKDVPDVKTVTLVLALGVCYRACLGSETEQKYDKYICQFFKKGFHLPGEVQQFEGIIKTCQDVMLSGVRLDENIARNQALKENVFMMVVCIELRIPLFLVGKPGSSKSLAKTIVSDAMQGTTAHTELFRQLKQAQMVSFQCSPLATAKGIQSVFKQCSRYQKNKNMDAFVAVVVLDEVGLAEDSPNMPLKSLHPLLEEGFIEEETATDYSKVAFVGISNWALDPAKMNRGLLVQRDVPSEEELKETARGICSSGTNETTKINVHSLIPKLAEAYLAIFNAAKETEKKREFFGLRDFYSLVKMVYAFAEKSGKPPSQRQLIAAVRRNFGGLQIDPVDLFKSLIPAHLKNEQPFSDDPDTTASGLIQAALSGNACEVSGESRYILLLTDNFGGLSVLTERLLADRKIVPIFGSSFPSDQEYTKVCTNINRIKVCMEMGQTVILLNLENLYESLYDALNQYYSMLGGERYVDLGLGTHRVKCRVHRQFRLIVVAEKSMVYDKFPIPLINRLEKHFLTVNNIMTEEQLKIAKDLDAWATKFVNSAPKPHPYMVMQKQKQDQTHKPGDVFMGYHGDTAPAIVLKAWDMQDVDNDHNKISHVLLQSQCLLLWCATPDAVIRSCEEEWNRVYHEEQQHGHLAQYLQWHLNQNPQTPILAQVTTHCRLLNVDDKEKLAQEFPGVALMLLPLQAFQTEQQFNQQIRSFFEQGENGNGNKLLLVQCDSGDTNQNLIKCAQYCVQDQMPECHTGVHIVFIIQLPRIASGRFTGFLGGNWHCLHIDELRTPDPAIPPITLLNIMSPAMLIAPQTSKKVVERTQKERETMRHRGNESDEETDSVEMQEITVEEREDEVEWGQPQGFSCKYVRQLLLSCVQPAVALVDKRHVETYEALDTRAAHRVELLLNLFRENPEFASGIHRMAYNVLKKKEEKLVSADRWLSKEAALLDSVQKAGTFQRSWVQCLENKIIPVLAGVIAYLDSCSNLDLLHRERVENYASWIDRAWLNILTDSDVCNINYDELLTTSGRRDLEVFSVSCPAAGSIPFACKLPFTWIVWELVNNAISRSTDMKSSNHLETAGNIVEQSMTGQCFQKAVGNSKEQLEDMFQCYISDMLLFVFKLSELEHQLFQQSIESGLRQLGVNLTDLEVGRGLVALHMLLEQMKPRLQTVLDMNDRKQGAVQEFLKEQKDYLEKQKENTDIVVQPLFDAQNDMTADVALLVQLLDDLQPDAESIKTPDGIKKWLSNYNKLAPVVVRVLSSMSYLSKVSSQNGMDDDEEAVEIIRPPDDTLPFGKVCQKQLRKSRVLWTRIVAVRLFLDYMEPLRRSHDKMTREAMQLINPSFLWKVFEPVENAKQGKTQMAAFNAVDIFMVHARKSIIHGLLGEVCQCQYCEKSLEHGPVELPCKHRLCQACYVNFCSKNRQDVSPQCPQCKAAVPVDFDPDQCEFGDAVKQLSHYQRQSSGFIMTLVSHLCFGGHENPEPEAVKHIIDKYIMQESTGQTLIKTKHVVIKDNIVDPTTVLRTFLLRLLLKYKELEVKKHLQDNLMNKYMRFKEEEAASDKGTAALVEFSLLVIFCVEDMHHEEEIMIFGEHPKASDPDWLNHVKKVFYNLQPALCGPLKQLDSLHSMGQLRYALDALSRIIYETFLSEMEENEVVITSELEKLFRVAKEVCGETRATWGKKFLIKQLCRAYGIESYSALVKLAEKQRCLEWISLDGFIPKVEMAPDMFLTCDELYKNIRDQLVAVQYDTDTSKLVQILEDAELADTSKEILVLLSLHRVSRMTAVQNLAPSIATKMRASLETFVQECDFVQEKETANRLLKGRMWSPQSPLKEPMVLNVRAQNLEHILLHFRLVLGATADNRPVLRPFYNLAFAPGKMKGTLLPTMPQDDFGDIIQAIEQDAQWGAVKIWRCSCGFRFVVGNCGRVVEGSHATCSKCGKRVGGQGYNQPLAGTSLADGADETQTGHILGAAKQRPTQGLPERQLSALECSLARFFTHASLFVGANLEQADVLSEIINPKIAQEEVCQFFWDHLDKDLKVIECTLGHTLEETCLFLHHICNSMSESSQAFEDDVDMSTKQGREKWEKDFAVSNLSPAITGAEKIFAVGTKLIVSDANQDQTALLNMVHELEEEKTSEELQGQAFTCPGVWRFRPRINLDHFFRQFQLQVESRRGLVDEFLIIKLFKEDRAVLQAMHFVPCILDLQRRLMNQLYRRLDKAEAIQITIGEAKEKKECEGVTDLLDCFNKTWEIVKERLISYACLTPFDGVVNLPEKYRNACFNEESPLAVLLPDTSGPGLCSYILLQYLLTQHNSFMEKYCAALRKFSEDWYPYKSLPEVKPRNIRERHLVSYTVESILPLVLANCNYDITQGQAAVMDYDFRTFQKQLQDNILECKSRVQRHEEGYIEVDTMVYKVDTTSNRLFKTVRGKIPQECLSVVQRGQIRDDLRGGLPDVCQSIDNLNTALSFLKALGGEPTLSLHTFMSRTLQMKTTIFSRRAQQHACLKNVQSLWVFLCFVRASILAEHRQDPFEAEGENLREQLDKTQELELKAMCKKMSSDRLELLLLNMFECIILRLCQPRELDDDTNVADSVLRQELVYHIDESPFYKVRPVELENGMLVGADLATYNFPESLHGRHAAATWLVCHGQLSSKRN